MKGTVEILPGDTSIFEVGHVLFLTAITARNLGKSKYEMPVSY